MAISGSTYRTNREAYNAFRKENADLRAKINLWPDAKMDQVKLSATTIVHVLADKARQDKVWKDRTGEAARKLNAFISDGSNIGRRVFKRSFYIVLAHGAVDPRGHTYGKFLETMQRRRFAILRKTLRRYKKLVFRLIALDLKNRKVFK